MSSKEDEKEEKSRDATSAQIDVTKPIPTLCMSCSDSKCDFHVTPFFRRALGEKDVLIKMKYCGVCHSDLHHAANHNHKMNKTKYPCVPGHELAGVVAGVGSKVNKVKIGDEVGVGCIVDSCLECDQCKKGEEQWCKKKIVGTYGARDRHGRAATYPVGGHTLGGYSQYHVCHEHFVITVPKGYPLSHAGPVMCAGITMYDPLIRHLRANKGKRIGIVGLGGLGVMGSKLARALDCHVTVSVLLFFFLFFPPSTYQHTHTRTYIHTYRFFLETRLKKIMPSMSAEVMHLCVQALFTRISGQRLTEQLI
jgi:hypothetical protein